MIVARFGAPTQCAALSLMTKHRHGARLDAADKQWHLTSPTPYDPPLTYGGWTQCRALGARIASLLQAREELSEISDDEQISKVGQNGHQDGQRSRTPNSRAQGRRRKHKVIVHSSPFLRCIQTSVAISAGISQYRGQNEPASTEPSTNKKTGSLAAPPRTNPSLTASPLLTAIPDEDAGHGASHNSSLAMRPHLKPRLRIDAFLGEWLSPDYYENITPPPGSVMMVAGAKADLLRHGDYIDIADDPSILASTKGHFPGGWGHKSPDPQPDGEEADDKLSEDVSGLSLKAAQRDRASTVSSTSSSRSYWQRDDGHILRASVTTGGYVPPVPRYAISPSDPIPSGYVNHARDACIEVDYQWDSMRPPQDWGDGGEYGEEWSHMHKRFRKGLQSMIAWYRLHHETANQSGGHQRVLHPHPHEEDDENTDTVLVLVTHGAGCNALIGALTNQPVLLDVSMASLTMAVRRDDESRPATPKNGRQSPSLPMSPYSRYVHGHPLSADYSVQLTASTDHLRTASASQPLAVPLLTGKQPHHSASQSQPSNILTSAPGPRVVPRRNRFDSMPGKAIDGANSPLFSPPDSPIGGPGIQRSASAAVRGSGPGNVGRSNSGLWSMPGSGTDAPPRRTWTMSSTTSSDGADSEKVKPPTSNPTSSPNPSSSSNGNSMWGVGSSTPKKNLHESAMQGNVTPPRGYHGSPSGSQPLFQGAPLPPAPLPSPSGGEDGDVVSPLGPGSGLWGGGSGGTKKGLPRKGMSAMAMALRGPEPQTQEEHDDLDDNEITKRQKGLKRRWTVNERGEMLG